MKSAGMLDKQGTRSVSSISLGVGIFEGENPYFINDLNQRSRSAGVINSPEDLGLQWWGRGVAVLDG